MADVIFRGVRVFDGRASVLSEPCDVRVTGSLIESIVPVGATAGAPAPGVEVFEGAGRVLMPGLIDTHWHAALAAVPVAVALSADPGSYPRRRR